jgi:hypothetical protein
MAVATRTNPYRIVVWGPGGLGRVAIREVTRMPEFELAGVLAYSDAKHGADAGELAGIGPIGIQVTTDRDEALAIDCDCVLHLARDFGRYGALDELVAILRAGRNVITVHPFQHIDVMGVTAAPAGSAELLAAACEVGGATFHATGIHPGMITDRMAGTLTGLCTDVRSIKVSENWDMTQYDTKTLTVIGYGRPPEQMKANPAVAQMTDNYCLQNLHGLSRGLGVELARTEARNDYAAAPTDLHLKSMDVPAGTVGRLTHTWFGYREADDEEPFLTMEVNWMVGRDEMLPAGINPQDYYVVEIEGIPSITLRIGIQASITSGQQLMDPDDPSSEPGYWATIATLLQAVPRVCAAAPGILRQSRPELHWTPDLRDLATQNVASTVGTVPD